MPPPLSRLLSRGFKAWGGIAVHHPVRSSPTPPTPPPSSRSTAPASPGILIGIEVSSESEVYLPDSLPVSSVSSEQAVQRLRSVSSRRELPPALPPADLTCIPARPPACRNDHPHHHPGASSSVFYRPVGQDAPPRWPLGARRAARGGGGGGGHRGRVRVRRGREGPGGGAGEDGQGEAAPGREDRAQVRPSSISSSSSSAQTSGPAAAAAAAALACCSCTQAAGAVGPDAVAADAAAVPERTTRTDSAPGPGTEASV